MGLSQFCTLTFPGLWQRPPPTPGHLHPAGAGLLGRRPAPGLSQGDAPAAGVSAPAPVRQAERQPGAAGGADGRRRRGGGARGGHGGRRRRAVAGLARKEAIGCDR